jgi:ribosomal protein S18 acetylase RimI-like enzyme
MEIKRLALEDDQDFETLSQAVYMMMSHRDFYEPFEGEFLEGLTPDNHFVLGCYDHGRMIAGFSVYFPNETDSYANWLDEKYPLNTVAHMDNCAVLPNYRGKKLQAYLCESCEQILKSEFPERVNLMCTVHPKNKPSLKNMQYCDYKVQKRVENMYGGFPRLIMYKHL